MKILAINSGSSSLKYKLIGFPEEIEISKNNIAIENDNLKRFTTFETLINEFQNKNLITNLYDLNAIVHRVVHGGEEFKNPVLITKESLHKIEQYSTFAPLHNPIQVDLIKRIAEKYPNIKQVAAFDTSFHLSMEKENFLYGLPYEFYTRYKVRRYGFHGLSHEYISKHLLKIEGVRNIKHISCHLGSGCSVAAIKDGLSIDNSFGFSPTENLIMATRSGEVDYDAIAFIKRELKLSDEEIENMLTKKSGLLGISDYTNDMKVLLADYSTKSNAKLAVDIFVNSVVKYIGSFYISLEGCDYLTFTGGIGAGSDVIRDMICKKLSILGLELDAKLNTDKIDVEEDLIISTQKSKIKVMVIPTNEELNMSQSALELIS